MSEEAPAAPAPDPAQRRAALDASHRITAREDSDGNLLVNTYQDVEPHMRYAAACRREDAERRGDFGRRPEMHRTMSLPFNIIQAVALRLGIPPGQIFESDHMKRIVAECKRPEFAAFRTTIDRRI